MLVNIVKVKNGFVVTTQDKSGTNQYVYHNLEGVIQKLQGVYPGDEKVVGTPTRH